MDHWQRLFAYITGTIVIGLMVIVFTNSFLQYVNAEGSTGYLSLLAYGLVFLNLGYGVSRRFTLKSARPPALSYLMAFLMAAPTLFWIFTKDEGLGNSFFVFIATILFAVFLGSYYGQKKGASRREEYLRKVYEEHGQDLPDNLKRPHDDLSKN